VFNVKDGFDVKIVDMRNQGGLLFEDLMKIE